MKTLIQLRLADAIAMKLETSTIRENLLNQEEQKVHAILGMRGSGKTSYLFQRMKELHDKGVGRTRLVYFNFEDERFSDLTLDKLHWIVEGYYTLYPENYNKKVYFFFDEIQNISGWGVFVNNLIKSECIQVFITGSSARLMRSEMGNESKKAITESILYPLSFRETLNNSNIKLPSYLSGISKNKKGLLENRILRFLHQGGFPEAQKLLELDRTPRLQEYVNTVIFRDIVERYGITNINLLKILVRHLLGNSGSQFSVNKYYNTIKAQGIRVAKTTLHEYMEYLQDSFLIHPVYIHTKSARQRMVNPRKIYANDPGLAVAYFTHFTPDTEHLLSNVILIELLRRGASVTYLSTNSGREVDFIATYPNGKTEAIQVIFDIFDEKLLKAKIKALEEAKSILDAADLFIITLTDEKTVITKNDQVKAIPSWKWLLMLEDETENSNTRPSRSKEN